MYWAQPAETAPRNHTIIVRAIGAPMGLPYWTQAEFYADEWRDSAGNPLTFDLWAPAPKVKLP